MIFMSKLRPKRKTDKSNPSLWRFVLKSEFIMGLIFHTLSERHVEKLLDRLCEKFHRSIVICDSP